MPAGAIVTLCDDDRLLLLKPADDPPAPGPLRGAGQAAPSA